MECCAETSCEGSEKGETIGAGVWQQRRLVGHKPPNEPNKCYLYKNV